MTLFSMALNNIKKSFKNYWTFFLSSTFSVFVLYLFISIVYDENVKKQLGSMKTCVSLFLVASCLIGLFSAFFIWYSNSFFVKSRKKEFATYMLLGMSKKQTIIMNLIENFIILFLAFFTGILLGLVFNKFFVMLLYVVIKSTGTAPFQLNLKALQICALIFSSIFVLIAIHSSILISKENLIDLFNSSKKAERGLKVSLFTFIISVMSIICLGYSYYTAIKKLASNFLLFPLVAALIVIGTILFFIGFTSLLIYLSKKNEKRLFKGTRLISTSQVFYRYRGNVGALSVIAVTTTIALCAMITCFGLLDKTEENSRYMRPYSIEYINNGDKADNIFESTLKKHKEITIKYKDNLEFLQVNSVEPFTGKNGTFLVLSESEFNTVSSHEKNTARINLKDNKDCFFFQISSYDGNANFAANKSIVGKTVPFSLPNISSNKYVNMKIVDTDMKYFIALDHSKETFIVKDSVYDAIKKSTSKDNIYNVTGYILKNDFISKNFISDLRSKIPSENNLLTFYEHFTEGVKLMGVMAFIGSFIGLVFLTATGSIIYFKMSMEAQEDKDKFLTLRKIGVSKAEISKAISKELLILFGMPFALATLNSFVGSICLGKMLTFKITKSFLIIVLVYALFYSVYYFITLNSYVKTVSE